MPPDHSCQTCKYRLVSCSPYWVDNQCQHWVSSQECATCPMEGRVVALEAQRHLQDVLDRQSTELFKEHSEALDAMEARLHALEEQHAELGRLHDEHVLLVHEQPLERPAAPAQRQPGVYPFCHQCVHFEVDMGKPPCVDCKQHWQPRQGAGL